MGAPSGCQAFDDRQKNMSTPATPMTMLNFAVQHNISLVARFHNELNSALAKRREELEKVIEQSNSHEEKVSLMCARQEYTGTFDHMLKATTFLLIYSHAEEFLYHLWRTKAKDTPLDLRKGSIKRFKPVLKVIGFDLGTDQRWSFLCDAAEVRDCLLHANGRISLMADSAGIGAIITKYGDELSIQSDRIVVSPHFVQKLQEIVLSLFSIHEN